MHKIVVFLFASFLLVHCDDDSSPSPCSTPATIRDFTSLDGCGWVFELENGNILEPVSIISCEAPNSPYMREMSPFGDLEPQDGRKVFIDYEVVESFATACMSGQTVKITCITDRVTVADQ